MLAVSVFYIAWLVVNIKRSMIGLCFICYVGKVNATICPSMDLLEVSNHVFVYCNLFVFSRLYKLVKYKREGHCQLMTKAFFCKSSVKCDCDKMTSILEEVASDDIESLLSINNVLQLLNINFNACLRLMIEGVMDLCRRTPIKFD